MDKGEGMNNSYDNSKRYLLCNSDEFKKNYEEHKAIHEKIESIEMKIVLSDSEKMDIKNLKRQKLYLKDKMEDMIYSHIRSQKGEKAEF